MQLRRFGLLPPLIVLAIAAGCSHPVESPIDETEWTLPTADESHATPAAPSSSIASLQPLHSLPTLQRAPGTLKPGDQPTEIIQTYYRPAGAEPTFTPDSKQAAKVEYGRAPNYEWLQGELIYSSVRGVWRLRYAASDDDDAYGGSVTLLAVSPTFALEAGQRVRVKGSLINPRSTDPSPYYHVRQLEPLGTP